MDFCYRFSAVKGIQAGREYYIAMVPLKMLARLFPNQEDVVLPEYRAQRRLNESRIPDIKSYILNNKDTYVFSALASSIDGEFEFNETVNNLGYLEVSMDARFLINDGQHRKASILAALEECPELGDETISVVFYSDQGLERSQQMFTDLNKHAVKTSNSLSELYDSRDELAVVTRKTISKIDFLDEYVSKENDILGKFSSALFTLNAFYDANKKILHRGKCDEKFERFLYEYWSGVVENMEPWNDLVNKKITKMELREQLIATQAIIIKAFGKVGSYLYENDTISLACLTGLRNINWKRTNAQWKQRVMKNNGRISSTDSAVQSAANWIKISMGLELTEDEKVFENKI